VASKLKSAQQSNCVSRQSPVSTTRADVEELAAMLADEYQLIQTGKRSYLD